MTLIVKLRPSVLYSSDRIEVCKSKTCLALAISETAEDCYCKLIKLVVALEFFYELESPFK